MSQPPRAADDSADDGAAAGSGPDTAAYGPTDEIARMWNTGWQRYVFPSLWLVYLAQTVGGVQEHSSGAVTIIGYLLVGAFAVVYLIVLPIGWAHRVRWFWPAYALTLAITAAEAFIAHSDAFVFLVYVSVLTVATRRSWAPYAIVGYAVIATFLPRLIPSWHEGIIWSTGLVILLVSFAMYGFFHVIRSNRALAAARAEVARLAAENERSRIARDLHDLLGHSLTTITVKAGLARRLGERSAYDQSLREITEVEQLARSTLGDVRAAVAGHREVTLAGELATAREVLRATAVTSELPGSVDLVDPLLSETFGWVVREGVTNVVRHAHAQRAWITLGPRWIEIKDDGHGSAPGCGNGLTGLRERLAAVSGTLSATGSMNGFTLRAEVPAAAPTSATRSAAAAAPAPALPAGGLERA